MAPVSDHVAQKTLPILQQFLDEHENETSTDDQLMSLEQLGISVSTEGKFWIRAFFGVIICMHSW